MGKSRKRGNEYCHYLLLERPLKVEGFAGNGWAGMRKACSEHRALLDWIMDNEALRHSQ
jgi:hypothetical protein